MDKDDDNGVVGGSSTAAGLIEQPQDGGGGEEGMWNTLKDNLPMTFSIIALGIVCFILLYYCYRKWKQSHELEHRRRFEIASQIDQSLQSQIQLPLARSNRSRSSFFPLSFPS